MMTVDGVITILESCLTETSTLQDERKNQMEAFGVTRRVVRWRLVSIEVNQHEGHDVFAGPPALKVFRMLIAKAARHRHTEHGHRKVIAILDAAVAFFHADMDEVINAHPPAEAEPDRTVVWLKLKAHYGTRKAARLWQEFLRNEVFMKAGRDAVAVEPNMYHKAGSLNDDDDAKRMRAWRRFHGGVDDRRVSRRRSDVGAQGRHQSAGNHWTWSGHKIQDCETNPILGSIRVHVASKSKARARSDHVGWIGTVESSSADAGYSCNDKDTEKRIGRVILGSC